MFVGNEMGGELLSNGLMIKKTTERDSVIQKN